MNLSLSRNVPRIDHREARARQWSAWASGDYAVAGNALQIVSEELCETVNLCQDERVLDVVIVPHDPRPAINAHEPKKQARGLGWCTALAPGTFFAVRRIYCASRQEPGPQPATDTRPRATGRRPTSTAAPTSRPTS